MITVHAKKDITTFVMIENPTTTKVQDFIAELAEVLISTGNATNDQVASLRLALETKDGWTALQDPDATFDELKITDSSVVGYTWGDDSFGYQQPEDAYDS